MMLNLPGSDLKKDEKMFVKLFSNPDFQPDQLKIYPCAVLKTAPLYKMFLDKQYQPYTKKQLINLLIKIKEKIPSYVRIIRIIRDIPANNIIAGNKVSNLRQVVQAQMKEENKSCQCIRCREPYDIPIDFKNVKLIQKEYIANNGKEIFLSYEDVKQQDFYLRLRLPNDGLFLILKILFSYELHSYGIVAFKKTRNLISNIKVWVN